MPDYLSPIANIINIALSSKENSLSTCDESSAVNGSVICDNNEECRYGDIRSGTMNVNSAICCTGAFTCQHSNVTRTKYGDIRCDGRVSCQFSYYVKTDGLTVGRGDIYMAGFANTQVGGYLIETGNSNDISSDMFLQATKEQLFMLDVSVNNLTDIVCSGKRSSCRYKIIRNSNNLFCNGFKACEFSSINNIMDNIYVYGWEGAKNATFIKNSGNLYCGSYDACARIGEITNIFGDIYGSGTRALWGNNITNVFGNVIAFGDTTLGNSSVTNASSVCRLQSVAVFLFFFFFALWLVFVVRRLTGLILFDSH